MSSLLFVLAALVMLSSAPAMSAEDHLVSHLNVNHVDVSTRFQGQSILLFGAVSRGTDVIIEVVSPNEPLELARKSRFGPVWLESGHVTVRSAPGLIYLLSSRPISELLGPGARRDLGLTLDRVLDSAVIAGDSGAKPQWGSALLRLKRQNGDYVEQDHGVSLEGGRLFYTHVDLPAQAPLGRYRVSIYLVRDGEVVQRQQQNLVVQEVHLVHWLSHTAQVYGWTFGALFTLAVMILGFVLGVALRPSRNA